MSKKKTSVFRRRKNKAETSSASSESTPQSAPASSVGNTVDQLKFVEPIDVTDVAREKTILNVFAKERQVGQACVGSGSIECPATRNHARGTAGAACLQRIC